MNNINIGKRLQIVRQARDLTIEDMFAKTGKKTYDRHETSRLDIKFNDLLIICNIFDISIEDLVAEKLTLVYKERLE